ncbi:midasin [Daedaleopsis nitida]|nr:midasin [Daedaleopsis nitida]
MDALTDSSHDPLRINLARQLRKLLALFPTDTPILALQNVSSRQALLDHLSALLLVPPYTMAVATIFKPILLDFAARWLQSENDWLSKFETLCLLLEPYPELYSVLATLCRMPGWERGPLSTSVPSHDADVNALHRILLAYYRLLQANPTLPRMSAWPLSPLSQIIWESHADNGSRFLSIRCYALQVGMSESERVKIEKEALGEPSEVDCPLAFGTHHDGSVRIVDGWVFPILELERVTTARDAFLQTGDFYVVDQNDILEPIHPAELCPIVANVHGVLMLRSASSTQYSSSLIDTPTTVQALRQIATHLSTSLPILLTSAPSSGKSLIISHLAQTLHPLSSSHIVTIHLADTSLDPRSLLGSYVSSPTRPGTFEWKEGVLVRAMREGKWIVLEDIDRATMEVLGILKPLVESLSTDKWIGGRARLDVPSRGVVEATDSFALFATRSLQPSLHGSFPAPTFFGAHKFYEVVVQSPTPSDLSMIVNIKFPRLAGLPAQALINLWDDVRALSSPGSTRDVGLRELERFCTRVSSMLPTNHQLMDIDEDATQPTNLAQVFSNPTVREEIFLEARDVFFGAGATTASGRAHLEAIANIVAGHLGLSDERRDWVLRGRTPEFDVEKDVNGRITAVRAGRSRLPARAAKVEVAPPITRPFAMHRPAVSLIARLAIAISLSESILLTGETGTGKTSIVTHLASLLRRPLISLNLSNQTESSDILGGFKPVDARVPGGELQVRFLELFGGTFSRKRNAAFEQSVRKAVQEKKWKRAAGLWLEAVRLAKGRIQAKQAEDDAMELEGGTSRKRRKVDGAGLNVSVDAWEAFERDVQTFEVQHVQGKSKFAFAFVEGPLVKALRNGEWILLDEVNLATPETLESISGLLHGPTASITLTEQGSLEPIPRHPEFRLFACMNPATDVGKKDLPSNIRARFTEIDVPPPDSDKETLLTIITQYIGACAVGDKGAIMDVADFYTAVKRLASERQIADGANHRPHFSMRTLTRALTFASDMAPAYSLRRALWEGCLMAFTMALDGTSATAVTALAQKHILAGVRNPRSLLTKEPLSPGEPSAYIKFGPFYLERGPLPEDPAEDYIMTPSVETKLVDLARIIAAKRFPVLIEGPTSSGKTSSIEYLAKRTGHRFVRINNHEHTDIQEYIGTYVSDPVTGKLVFKEGLLVRALRQGDWIVLDELNLAPTDVLEALNRLLDDNRELVIPETQEVVRPHAHFMLFATQNPPGLYAGRKVLSRAFRNRFLEVHFEDVPQAELETILCQRCRIAPSYGQRIVSVFRELQKRRQSSRVFESKHGFATLRDLFRWAGRDAISYDELAANGYMLLAERTRRDDDKAVVKEVIESIMKVRIDESSLYNLRNAKNDTSEFLGCPAPSSSQVVWTAAMQRLFVLTARALRFNEPVLLVGETGCGKTSVCQLYAKVLNRVLRSVNCHQNTETADLIGGLRPIRNKAVLEAETLRGVIHALSQLGATGLTEDAASLTTTIDGLLKTGSLPSDQVGALQELRARLQRLSALFEWRDGPLVEAMRNGDVFLLDEISLADDSVLERLNSVLETGRTIVLAERGGNDAEIPAIKAAGDFKLVATMNPGGDYGKKELSPALRNRFTEIWVPPITDRRDLECIVETLWQLDALRAFTQPVLDFVEWLSSTVGDRSLANLRDILAWVSFSNATLGLGEVSAVSPSEIFHHAAQMTFLDGLGSMPQLSSYSKESLERLKSEAVAKLQELVPVASSGQDTQVLSTDGSLIRFGAFPVPRGPQEPSPNSFSLEAPTTRDNVMRVVRACQLPKPIMLEGSPGVGKTSLVAALANMCGHHLCRINLSDQTDLVDLFGSDLPVEGGEPGQFAWKDAEFLRALQEGHWVLLDEMNLAPQSVLEGLNAVLDHRGTVYIPELGRSFARHPSFRVFAAQNPLHQGGGRKGLPKSFLNRFTKVYVQEMSAKDLLLICQNLFPQYPPDLLQKMIAYMSVLNEETMVKRSFAREGAPWEFNLRDVIRWATLLHSSDPPAHPSEYLSPVILQRFRTSEDRSRARELFSTLFPSVSWGVEKPPAFVSPSYLQVGRHGAFRGPRLSPTRSGRILQASLPALESLGICIENGWLAILTGPKNCGKTTLVRTMASLLGKTLQEVSINNATDAMDILGSFEETDIGYCVSTVIRDVVDLLEEVSCSGIGSKSHAALDSICRLEALPRATTAATVPHVVQVLTEVLNSLSDLAELDQARCSRLRTQVQGLSSRRPQAAQLDWVDGPLVHALKEGHWILLDGANLCSPSVLDRLNSLCEMGGSLALNERGAVNGEVQVLRPHPGFRLFMCADIQHGELSRAMRNRGIEIALFTSLTDDDWTRVVDHIRCSPRFVSTYSGQDLRQVAHVHAVIRRGLGELSGDSFGPTSIPATRLLAQDSSNAGVVDLMHCLTSSIGSTFSGRAELYFLAAHLIPNALHHLRRLVSYRDSASPTFYHTIRTFLDSLEYTHLYRTIILMRKNINQKPSLLPDALFAQPLYAVHGREHTTTYRENDRDQLLRYLRLLVSATVDYGEPLEDVHQGQDVVHSNERARIRQLATNQARLVVNSVQNAATAFLAVTDMDRLECGTVEKLLDIVAFGRFLRGALCSLETFDFSLALAISEWIKQVLRDLPAQCLRFSDVLQSVATLDAVIALKPGLALNEIWEAFTSRPSADVDGTRTAELECAGSQLRPTANEQALRSEILNVMSMWRLPANTDDSHDGLSAITTQLNARVQEAGTADDVLQQNIDFSYIFGQLHVLNVVSRNAPELHIHVQALIDYGCSNRSVPLTTLVPYKQLLWTIDASQETTKVLALAQKQWLEEIWEALPIAELHGPSAICHPVELSSTLLACDSTPRPSDTYSSYDLALQRRLKMLSSPLATSTDRWSQLAALLVRSIIMVFTCIARPSSILCESDTVASVDVTQIIARLDASLTSNFTELYRETLRPHLLTLMETGDTRSYAGLGRCWIALSRILLTVYVPNIPIDPAVTQQCSHAFWSGQIALLEAELDLAHEYETRTTGNKDSPSIRYLEDLVEAQKLRRSGETPLHSSRFDVARLHAYWTEVSQFLEQVVSSTKVDGVIAALEAGELSAAMREQVIQESTAAFTHRLDEVYGHYADISMPIQLALLQLRLGLRLVSDATSIDHVIADNASLAGALLSFPSVQCFEALATVPSQQSSNISFGFVLWQLASIVSEIECGVELQSQLPQVELIYEKSLGLSLVEKARKEEEERQAQSLYRHKTEVNGLATDAEIEEQEFLALFPEFEDLLGPSTTTTAPSSTNSLDLIKPTDVKRLATLHQRLFEGHGASTVNFKNEIRTSLLHDLFINRVAHLPEILDQHSRPFQIAHLLDRLEVLHGATRTATSPFNFYTDCNVTETRKASDVLQRMIARLVSLVREWPEQMVLQHLKDRCEAIIRLDLFSPIAKVLSAVEHLLLQMEDWEMYANRENTLRAYQHELANLVVSWRRLELTSWQGLLLTQALEFADGASEWWFRLYEATVRGVDAASAEEENGAKGAVAAYLEGLVPLLDSFMTSSPLGQYSARLHHLRAFERYSLHLGKRSDASNRAHRVLHFTTAYYAQFLDEVDASLSTQRQALEKEIRNFIKLASWKDINVHALKQSAQKTHRQLYKCVRRFREILRQPVNSHLVPGTAGSEDTSTFPLPALHLFTDVSHLPPLSDTQPDHLLHLDKTFRNFQHIIQGRAASLIRSISPDDVEDLANEVITTLQSLVTSSPPVSATAEQRAKFHKALGVRKRKAWSDLLKELKRIGLNANVKPEVLEQQSNARWLREHPLIEPTKESMGPVEKIEVYLLRLTKLLPDLRTSLGNHHPDMGTRDLQRGTNMVASGFSLAIDARNGFANAVEHYNRLQKMVSRLRVMSQQDRVVASGVEVLTHVVSIKDDLGRLVNALEETRTIWDQYIRRSPETNALSRALEELHAAHSASQAMFNELEIVTANMRMLDVSLLTESEATVVQNAREHVQMTLHMLSNWVEGPNIAPHFVKPLLLWLENRESFAFVQFTHEPAGDITHDSTGLLIDRLLISVQSMLALAPAPSSPDSEPSETPDRFVQDQNRLMGQFTRSLKIQEVNSLLTHALQEAVVTAQEELQKRITRVFPFLDTYLKFARVQLSNHCAWSKALFKLDYVICSVMHSIAKDGFCRPPEASEGETGQAGTDDAGGMGIGEGSGNENVSKDIQDESQVEGLQGEEGEEGEDENVERAEEGNALEMSEDFGGKMQDLSDAGEEDEDEGDDEREEPEEQLGDLDVGDPSAVDEKLWGNEAGPEDSNDDPGKSKDDHSTKHQDQESETVAKEEDGRKPSNDKAQDKQNQSTAQEEVKSVDEDEVHSVAGEENMEPEEDQDHQGGRALDEFVPEADTLELPDDVDFGKEDETERDIDEDIDMGDESGSEERSADDSMQDAGEEDSMEMEGDEPQMMQEDGAQSEGPMENAAETAMAQPDLHAGVGQDSEQAGGRAMPEADHGDGSVGPLSSRETGGNEGAPEQRESAGINGTPEEQADEHTVNPPSANDAEDGKDGSGSARTRQGAAPSQGKLQPPQQNPLRSLGDALREISQRIDDIMEASDAPLNIDERMDTALPSQLEYIHPCYDTDKDEMQALGPAQQEDVVKLNDLQFLDDELEAVNDAPPVERPLDTFPGRTPQDALHAEGVRSQQEGSSTVDPGWLVSSDRSIPSAETKLDAQEEIELALRQWQAAGQPEGGAADLWRKYESLTHDLSYSLCEQLRLILEPTLATRLKGDYRTGKRLNMKKIIPYIASEFTKDKIWLRRTRPSQREYQVLIALDDSRSMAESHSVHLALQTLALVSKALGKLEVGDIAVVKFGEAVDVLHGFDGGPFTDLAGTRVMRAFRFDQKATQVLSLINTSLKLLEQAKERRLVSSSSTADLWQLEIIISDGICQDHDRLRTVLRRAEEQQVMVVFIILDSLHSNKATPGADGQKENSILSMNQVAYKMVDGRMDLKVERYLDSFPFEYYVILRDVEALPDVLSGTLKQFFERIAEA